MSNQIRVRVKCQSMTQLRQENKSRKEQENEWDRFVNALTIAIKFVYTFVLDGSKRKSKELQNYTKLGID